VSVFFTVKVDRCVIYFLASSLEPICDRWHAFRFEIPPEGALGTFLTIIENLGGSP
jgi:hypothetical protein